MGNVLKTNKYSGNPNVIDLPNNNRLNFSALGGTSKITERVFFSYIKEPNKKRKLNMFLKLQGIVTEENITKFSNTVYSVFFNLISHFMSINRVATLNYLEELDEYDTNVNEQILGTVRHNLSKILGTDKITCLFSDNTENIFDIYFDSVLDPKDITYNTLEFAWNDLNGTINISRKQDIQISIFINPKSIRKLIVSQLAGIKDDVYTQSNIIDVVKLFSLSFVESFVSGIISDYYRENRVSQFIEIFNIINDFSTNENFAKLLAGSYKNKRNTTLDISKANRERMYIPFEMTNTETEFSVLQPTFNKVINDMQLDTDIVNLCSNPIDLYKLVFEIPSTEIKAIFEELKVFTLVKPVANLSNLFQYTRNDNEETKSYKTMLVLNRLLPLTMISSYIVLQGSKYPITTKMLEEIKNVLGFVTIIGARNVNLNQINSFINHCNQMLTYIPVLSNPLNVNKVSLSTIINSLTMFEEPVEAEVVVHESNN